MDLERACGGNVRRWDLRPDDWHRIWPELIGTEGAPAAPAGTELTTAVRRPCTCGAWEMAAEEPAAKSPPAPPVPPAIGHAVEPALAPAAAMLLGGRRDDDHPDPGFGVLDDNGEALIEQIDARSRLVGDVPRRGGSDAS